MINILIFSEPTNIIIMKNNRKYGKIIMLVLAARKPKIGGITSE
jgi:hypothetical protein